MHKKKIKPKRKIYKKQTTKMRTKKTCRNCGEIYCAPKRQKVCERWHPRSLEDTIRSEKFHAELEAGGLGEYPSPVRLFRKNRVRFFTHKGKHYCDDGFEIFRDHTECDTEPFNDRDPRYENDW